MRDPFNLWREGQAYRTPKPAPVSPPICKACGSRHRGATERCTLTNEQPKEED